MDKSESRVREEARQRDHRQLCDMLAGFLEEVRRSGHSMVSESLDILSPQLVNQVSPTRRRFFGVIPWYGRIRSTSKLWRREVPAK